MDSIQALSSKAKQAAALQGSPSGAMNDDDSAAGAFAALLDTLSPRFKTTDTGLNMDAKLLNGVAEANARASETRDTVREARDAAKARDDKNAARAGAAKPKSAKSRTQKKDDSDSDQTQAADDADTQGAAETAQAGEDKAATVVVSTVAVDVPLVTIETIAPVLIAQQVQAPVAAATQQTADVVTATAATAAVDTQAAAATAANTLAATEKAVTVEAPAAVQKVAESAAPVLKQAAVEAAAPVEADTTEDAAKAATVVNTDATNAKTKDNTQPTATVQRTVAAQQQSQDLSRQLGPDTKAQVHVTVNGQAAAQTATTTGVYDIYSGYNAAQSSTANGQVGATDAGNALGGTKTPAETAMAQAASQASPAAAPPSQPQASQQGASSSAARADIAAPAPAQTGGANSGQTPASYGDAPFSGSGANTQGTASTTASAPTTATERPLATAQQIIDQIKVNITRAAKAGLDHVTIRLKPLELGRIDVKLEMSDDHKVRVEVTADNKDTLALLQADSRTLERALNDAGLRTDTSNLHFSLRGEGDAQTAGDGKGNGKDASNGAADGGATDDADDIAMTYDYTEVARARGGVDTFA